MDNEFQTAYEESIVSEGAVTQPEVGTEQQVEQVAQTQETVTEPTPEPQKINIEGLGEFTVDEIKEFKNGYMRQSDYTRKTQEIARQRKEIEELRRQSSNPYIQPNLAPQVPGQRVPYVPPVQATELELRLKQLEENVADRELDNMITSLKEKYPDFDEVKVLNTAYEKGLTDLEFVYKSLREPEQVNVETIKEQLRQEILNEIQQNKGLTSTIIADGNAPVQNKQVNLSSQELAIATELGLTPEEYIQYK